MCHACGHTENTQNQLRKRHLIKCKKRLEKLRATESALKIALRFFEAEAKQRAALK
jgi:hypothetical protein